MSLLPEYRALVAVAETGSFVAAAETLRLSKSAVSKSVGLLERRLGVRLLHRTTRRVALTPEGEFFVGRARDVLALIDATEAELSERRLEAVGRLRINAPLSYGHRVLARHWARFAAANPRLQLDIVLGDRITDLVEEGFDVAVRIARSPSPLLVHRRLAPIRVYLAASPDYLARVAPIRHPRDLATHEVVSYANWSDGTTWRLGAGGTEADVEVRPSVMMNNGDACVAAAIAGGGVVLQPDFLVDDAIERGALQRVLPEWEGPGLSAFAVYPSRNNLPLKVRRVVDFLVATLGAREPTPRRPSASLG